MTARQLLALLLVALGSAAACRPKPAPEPAAEVVIATGPAGGVYDLVGKALTGVYNGLPRIRARIDDTGPPGRNLEKLQQGSVDVGFDGAGFAYAAFSHGTDIDPRQHSRLRAIAVLFSTSVQIVARADSGIRRIEDFRGKRLAVGASGGSTDQVAQLILSAHQLSYHEVTPVFRGGADFVGDLRDRRSDGFVLYMPFPHATVSELADARVARLVPMGRAQIDRIQARSPFLLKTVVIPAGTYNGQAEDVATVGADILLLCRDNLPESLVYDLTRELFAAVPRLAAAHPAAAGIDPDRGPAASVPLHPGAARYYRERELLR